MIHSEAMFFEIMCLYAIFTDYVELELDILKMLFMNCKILLRIILKLSIIILMKN